MSYSVRAVVVGVLCLALTSTAAASVNAAPTQASTSVSPTTSASPSSAASVGASARPSPSLSPSTTPPASAPLTIPASVTPGSTPTSRPATPSLATKVAKAVAAQADAPGLGGPGEYQYDAAGRLAGVVQNGTQAARYSYDAAGNITGVSRYAATQLAVASVVPAIARPGADVTLYGTGFPTSGAAVKFNGAAAAVTKATATALTVTVPAAVTTGAVSVTASGSTISGPVFTVAAAGPAISALSPAKGLPGSSVTISGSGFSTSVVNDVVLFNGVRASVSAATATSLTVAVPLTASSGRVSVATPAGTASATGDFIVPPSGVDPATIESVRRLEPGSAPTAVPVTTAGDVALVLFDAPASKRINLGLTASTFGGYIDAELIDSRGKKVTSYSGSGAFELDAAELTAGATYQLVIAPDSTLTGQVTITVSAPQSATLSTTAAGTVVALTRAGQDFVGTVTAAAGQHVSIGFSANTLSAYSYASIIGPDGSVVVDDDYLGGGSADSTRFTASVAGSYTLVLDPSASATGSITVTAAVAVATSALLPTAAGTVVALGRPGQTAVASFTGAAGQSADLGLSANTLTSSSYLDVIAPDGSVLVNDDYVSSASSDYIALDTLPATGTYQVLLQPNSAATGSVTLTYSLQVDAGALTATSATTAVTIGRPGQGAKATFNATAGVPVSLTLSGNTLTSYTYVDVLTPSGTKLVSSSYVSTSSDGVIRFTPTVSGIHVIRIRTNAAATGSVSLTLATRVAAGTLTTTGAAVKATVSRPGQDLAYTFAGTAGQPLTLGLTGNTLVKSFYLVLQDSSGKAIGSSQYVSAGSNPAIRLPSITTTGTYTVLLQSDYAWTGTISATLSTDLAVTAAVGGAGIPVSIARAGQYVRISLTGVPGGADVTAGLTNVSLAGFTEMDLVTPGGTVTNDAYYLSGSSGSAIFLPTPTTAGTYQLVLKPDNAVTGSLTVTASTGVVVSPTTSGAPVAVTTTKPGQQARVQFTASAGASVSLGVSSSTFPSYLEATLVRPDGTKASSLLVSGTDGDLDFTALPQTGSYAILFQPSGIGVGSFAATLSSELAAGSLAVGGAAKPVAITRAGQNARLTFAGTTGQSLQFKSTSTSSVYLDVWVYSPTGSTVVNDEFISASSGSFTLPALPSTGTYQVLVDPYQGKTASVNLTLATAPAAAAATSAQKPSAQKQAGGGAAPVAATVAAQATSTTSASANAAARHQVSTSDWQPDKVNLRGQDWVTRRPLVKATSDLSAPSGVTALSGHALTLDGRPLPAVTVTAGKATTRTDAHGRFLLRGVTSATTTIIVDGASASRPGARYGLFRIRVDIKDGRTTALPATIWMPRLDTKHTVRISAPTTSETVLTTPQIPGLEVRIPAGSVVRDLNGKVVTELGITPIPIDRTPYPLPKDGIVPVFFTVQPGGAAVFPKGAQIVYPNYTHLPPGQTVDFWNYDPTGKGWFVYGHGQVSADGKQVVPDAKTRIWTFDGAMFNTGSLLAWLTSRFKDVADWLSGDPVDLSTGLIVDHRTDLAVDDVMPIQVSRTLWQGDTVSREFGVGQIADYGMFLHSEQQYQEVDLYVPGGSKIHYVRTSAGTGYTDAVFGATGTSSEFRNSTIKWYSPISGWELTLTDGTRYRFPMFSRATAILDRNGNQITLTRDSDGNLTQITSPSGRWIALTYDTSGRVTQARDNAGRTVSYTYDTTGRLSTVTDPGGHVSTYTYDTSGRLKTLKDGRGIVYLTNEYDANGRVSKQTLPDGAVYTFAYTLNAAGAVTETRVTQPNGAVRRVAFNSAGAPTSDTDAYGTSLARTTTFTRGTDQRITDVTDPFGRKTHFGFDSAGRVNGVTDLYGTSDAVTTSSATFGGPFDQPDTVTDAAGKVTRYTYDTSGNLLTSTDAEGRVQKFSWTPDGQVKTATDPADKVTTFGYTAGDLTSVTDPLGQVSKRFVDAAGRVAAATDPAGNTTTITYDPLNEPTRATDALGDSTSFQYDQNGNLTKLTDPRSKVLGWTYTDSDQVKTATDQLGKVTAYDYDTAGRPKSVTSRAGRETTYGFDALDRPSTVAYGVTSTGSESSATFGYDTFDRPKTITDTASGTATFGYDVHDNLTSVAQARGTVTYKYDANGRQISTTAGTQPATTYGYDNTGLLKSVLQGNTSVGIGYDADGRQTKTTLPGGWSQTNAYDDASRLTGISYANGSTAKGAITYTYDAAGRVRTVSGAMANVQLPAARTGLTYNDANRLTAAGGATLTYDNDGNLTNDGSAAYTWDARGELTKVSRTGLTSSFGYDPLGDRSARTVNGTTTGFLNDGANTSAELDSANNVTSSLLSGGLDQWYARTKGGVTDTVLTDAQGSPVALGAPDGSLAARYGYDPYGTPTTSGTTRGADLSYTGRQDDGTGLMYYRDRYYSPALQRFISEDPAGVAGGVNLYAYAGDSPTNATDPSGDNPLLIGCAIGAITDGGISYLSQRLSGRKVDWGWNGVGGSALQGCAFGMLGAGFGLLSEGAGAEESALTRVCNCFPAGTTIQTDQGSKPIEQVKVGDQVWAKNLQTGTPELRRVTGLFDKPTDELVDLDVGGDRFQVTPDHPFWVVGKGWTDAGQLKPGDRLADRRDDDSAVVRSVDRHPAATRVYNFEVEGDDDYYVTDAQLLVHNCQISGTQGLLHSFSRHAAQWFGRPVSGGYLSEWEQLVTRAGRSSVTFDWSTGAAETTAHLARIDGKYIVVQFFKSGDRAGELATAFVPNNAQLGAMLRAAGIIP